MGIAVWNPVAYCRGCKADQLSMVMQLQPMPIGNRFTKTPNSEELFPVVLVMCEICKLVQLGHHVDSKLVFNQTHRMSGEPINEKLIPNHQSRIDHRTLYIGGHAGNGESVPDFASNETISLESYIHFQQRLGKITLKSWESAVDQKLIEQLVAQFGLFNEIIIDNSSKSSHPLHISNIEDPRGYLEKLGLLLRPEGVISIQLPDLSSILRYGHIGYIYHEHQSYFSSRSLLWLLQSLGFEAIHAVKARDKLNARYRFCRSNLPRKEKIPHAGLITDSIDCDGTEDRKRYDEFVTRLVCTRERVREEIELAGSNPIIGYGASVATITTMYQLCINDWLDYLVDDSDRFCDQFSPKDNLKVVQYKESERADDPTFVLLATRYEGQIIRKHGALSGHTVSTRMYQ